MWWTLYYSSLSHAMLKENTDAWVGSATVGSGKHVHVLTQIFVTRFGFKVFKVNDSV